MILTINLNLCYFIITCSGHDSHAVFSSEGTTDIKPNKMCRKKLQLDFFCWWFVLLKDLNVLYGISNIFKFDQEKTIYILPSISYRLYLTIYILPSIFSNLTKRKPSIFFYTSCWDQLVKHENINYHHFRQIMDKKHSLSGLYHQHINDQIIHQDILLHYLTRSQGISKFDLINL